MNVFCIGGLGGSGTRLVTNLLQKHALPIGSVLNTPLDNLLFTLLFRRPSWFIEFPSDAVILKTVDVFMRNMRSTTGSYDTLADQHYINNIIESNDISLFDSPTWYSHLEAHFQNNQSIKPSTSLWGWKEPNTHVFLPQLNTYDNEIKYIHVVRDGIYMMNSKNQNQLNMWASKYEVKRSDPMTNKIDSLSYWVAANAKAISFGTTHLKNRFYLLNYDLFCEQPETQIERLMNFLETPCQKNIVNSIVDIIKHERVDQQARNSVIRDLPHELQKGYKSVEDLIGSLET